VFNVLEANNRAEYSILLLMNFQLPSIERPDTLQNIIGYNDQRRLGVSSTGYARSKACLRYLEMT
jgi:hypothetical protein